MNVGFFDRSRSFSDWRSSVNLRCFSLFAAVFRFANVTRHEGLSLLIALEEPPRTPRKTLRRFPGVIHEPAAYVVALLGLVLEPVGARPSAWSDGAGRCQVGRVTALGLTQRMVGDLKTGRSWLARV